MDSDSRKPTRRIKDTQICSLYLEVGGLFLKYILGGQESLDKQ